MPRDMFGDVVNPSITVGTQKWYTVPLSILAHVVVLGALIVIPLMATDVLPTPSSMMAFAVPPPPPAAPQPVVAPPNPNAAPVEAPKEIKPEPPPPPSYSMGGVTGGVAGGIPGGTMGGIVGGIAPPPPPPEQKPLRVGGDIKEPKRIHNVDPIYPPIALQAKVEGYVIVEATIGKDGVVKDVKIVKPNPLLQDAALAAVKQWVYSPPLLNGQPVEVLMNVTVVFKLR